MVKRLSEFQQIDGLDDVYTAGNGKLRCCALRLKTGGLCLFSPVAGLNEATISSLAAVGEVQFLLAPNHYHNKGMIEYGRAFPDALICAPPNAHARLNKVTGLEFQGLDAVQAELADTLQLVFPPGLKTGEVWIRVEGAGHTAWLVVDAFAGLGGTPEKRADTPGMLTTFPRYGVADQSLYLDWVEEQIEQDNPTLIVPCHGTMISHPKLAQKLRRLIRERLS